MTDGLHRRREALDFNFIVVSEAIMDMPLRSSSGSPAPDTQAGPNVPERWPSLPDLRPRPLLPVPARPGTVPGRSEESARRRLTSSDPGSARWRQKGTSRGPRSRPVRTLTAEVGDLSTKAEEAAAAYWTDRMHLLDDGCCEGK